MRVDELIARLSALPPDAEVDADGCDCIEPAVDAFVYDGSGSGRVLISRRPESPQTHTTTDTLGRPEMGSNQPLPGTPALASWCDAVGLVGRNVVVKCRVQTTMGVPRFPGAPGNDREWIRAVLKTIDDYGLTLDCGAFPTSGIFVDWSAVEAIAADPNPGTP